MDERHQSVFRGSYPSESRTFRDGEQASLPAVWRLLSFLEFPANVRASLLASDQRSRQERVVPHYYTAERLISRHRLDSDDLPVALNVNDESQLNTAVLLTSTAIRHAHGFLEAAEGSANSVRPVYLYYGCLNLAKALVAATFAFHPSTKRSRGHGLTVPTGSQIIRAFPNGGFPAFHDAICSTVEFYHGKDGRAYGLDVLLAAIPEIHDARARVRGDDLRLNRPSLGGNVQAQIQDLGGSPVWTHIMALELMAAFTLSCWSRYEPVEWEQKLRGEISGEAHVYTALMDYVAHDFPLRTFNLMTGENHFFGPAKMSEDEFKRRFRGELAQQLSS